MRIKVIIVVLAIVLTFAIWYQSGAPSISEVTNIAKPVEESPLNQEDKPVLSKHVVTSQANAPKIEITQETSIHVESVYDSDPVVDAAMIISRHRLCIHQLEQDSSRNKYMELIQEKLDDKQRLYMVNLKKHCQKVNQEHPEYHLTNPKKLREQKQKAIATSTWGKIMTGELSADDLSEFEIEDLLKQNSIGILSQAPRYLQKYYQEVVHWDLEDALQNHQYDYTLQVADYAHKLYLCTIGDECGAQSSTMSVLCLYNTQACNLTYSEYIENVLTQGQQADVQLALGYLRGKYN